jgi:hypothetical protein
VKHAGMRRTRKRKAQVRIAQGKPALGSMRVTMTLCSSQLSVWA